MVDAKKMLELIVSRQSDRKYSEKPVEKEKLDRIIEAGRMAPSACNAQPWRFVVVTEPKLIGKIAEAASARLTGMNTFVAQAPVILVVIRERPNFSSKVGTIPAPTEPHWMPAETPLSSSTWVTASSV